jgi:hypothetical protein
MAAGKPRGFLAAREHLFQAIGAGRHTGGSIESRTTAVSSRYASMNDRKVLTVAP